MVSKLRLCRATQFARASASATVIIASTSTASCSPKIKVDVIGSKPSASPKGLGRSPTIAFPGAVKTFTLSVVEAAGAVKRVGSFGLFVPSIWYSSVASERATTQREIGRGATKNQLDKGIDPYRSTGRTSWSGAGQRYIRTGPARSAVEECYEEDDGSDYSSPDERGNRKSVKFCFKWTVTRLSRNLAHSSCRINKRISPSFRH